MEITREIQLDAGHRIPFHKSHCSNVHGHRYRVVATLEGTPVETPDVSDQGMLMDFGDMKRILMERIHAPLDHGFMVWKGDSPLREFLESNDFKVVVMEDVPTAETIARWCFFQVRDAFRAVYGNVLRLRSVTVWETPGCSARYTAEEVEDPAKGTAGTAETTGTQGS